MRSYIITLYSKTCGKLPLSKRPKIDFQDQLLLNVRHRYCRMLQESILQYFWPSFSYHLSLSSLFCLFWVAVVHSFYWISSKVYFIKVYLSFISKILFSLNDNLVFILLGESLISHFSGVNWLNVNNIIDDLLFHFSYPLKNEDEVYNCMTQLF